MAKEAMYLAQAERHYVVDQCTIAEIASRLRLGEKTVRVWKQKYDWDRKRQDLLASRRSLESDLYEFVTDLMQSVREDFKAGNKVDPGRLYALTKLLPSIGKAHDYEELLRNSNMQAQKKGPVSKEDAVRAVQKVLGIIDEDDADAEPVPEDGETENGDGAAAAQ